MTIGVCAKCGSEFPRRSGRVALYCSTKCRVAAARGGTQPAAPPDAQIASPVTTRRPRASTAGVPTCPDDPGHGPLYAWTKSESWGWWCAHSTHGGNGKFFRTADLETPTGRPERRDGEGGMEVADTRSRDRTAGAAGDRLAGAVIPPAAPAGELVLGL